MNFTHRLVLLSASALAVAPYRQARADSVPLPAATTAVGGTVAAQGRHHQELRRRSVE
ncbi:hypothetical protein ACELLULO517_23055 [Acidisoma cellulosilytica]|uniref:Uncharacterized protein n=1 Tax=Acidisoma cellulosilyticum TaxID=2802395 RepID=A0A963Z5F8_9PROT|nr:hypothetical protein [Acidisoma cellulosilyticum]MCB8883147.1 hypothetical protein [Acidisoma cellulosilyticum]